MCQARLCTDHNAAHCRSVMQPEQTGVQVRTAWHAVLPFKDCEAVVPTTL